MNDSHFNPKKNRLIPQTVSNIFIIQFSLHLRLTVESLRPEIFNF